MDCGWIVLQGCESWSKEALQARRDCCATSEWTRLLYEWKFPVVLPLHLPAHVREQKIDGGNPNLLASTSQKPFLLCVWSQVWIHRNHFCFLSLCVYSSSTTPDTWQQYNSYFILQCWRKNKCSFTFVAASHCSVGMRTKFSFTFGLVVWFTDCRKDIIIMSVVRGRAFPISQGYRAYTLLGARWCKSG